MARIIKDNLFEIADNEFRVMVLENEEWEDREKDQVIQMENELWEPFTPKQLKKLALKLIQISEATEKLLQEKEVNRG